MTYDAPPIVVGVDGSPTAILAARWAGALAVRLDAPLDIVHAIPSMGHNLTDAVAAIRAAAITEQRDAAATILKTAEEAVRSDQPELSITVTARQDPADEALVALSRDARMVVVGCDDVTPGAALLMGSTTLNVATEASCCVVAWRGAILAPTTQSIVVGVDDSGDPALGAAFELAERLDAPLRAVHAWSMRRPAAAVTIPFLIDWDALEAAQLQEATAAVEPWSGRHPNVDVSVFVEPDKPSLALLEHLDDAQLVVIGNRGRNALTGLLLGSTGLNMLHHSPVPVMLCHTPHPRT
jgi:nucleotide-binding universal stress UspA family protein